MSQAVKEVLGLLTDFMNENEGREASTIRMERIQEMVGLLSVEDSPKIESALTQDKEVLANALAEHVVQGSETEEELSWLYRTFYNIDDIVSDLKEKGYEPEKILAKAAETEVTSSIGQGIS